MANTIYDIPLRRIDGKAASLADYAGDVLLIVNVASQCGKTPQYEGLESLYKTKRDKGFAVLGFPCNQFDGQEPGTEAEIAEFCRSVYGVDFPMFSKLDVKGPEQHPLYKALTAAQPTRSLSPAVASPKPVEGDVRWNFEKFLVSSRRPYRRPLRPGRDARRRRAHRCDREGTVGATLNLDEEETGLMRTIIALIAAVAACAVLVSPAGAASFDCNKATAPDEIAICANPDLSALDSEMGGLWFAYSSSHSSWA